MAENNNEEVFVGLTGDVHVGATTSPAPVSENTPVPATFKKVALLTEDGIEIADGFTQTPVRAWQNNAIARQINTDEELTITLAALQLNDDNFTWWTGSTKLSDGSWEVNPSNTGGRKSYDINIFDLVAGVKIRIFIPEAELSSRNPLSFTSTSASSLGATIQAYRSEEYGYTYKLWRTPITIPGS